VDRAPIVPSPLLPNMEFRKETNAFLTLTMCSSVGANVESCLEYEGE